jgi:periplasmic divalent cation tolerance protein
MEKDTIQYGVVMVTTASQIEGERIGRAVVESRLAACVTLIPIQSIYAWQGEINSEQEWQLFIKTDLALFSALASEIQALHSYDVPEIIALPIVQGSQPYLEWIGEHVRIGEKSQAQQL